MLQLLAHQKKNIMLVKQGKHYTFPEKDHCYLSFTDLILNAIFFHHLRNCRLVSYEVHIFKHLTWLITTPQFIYH